MSGDTRKNETRKLVSFVITPIEEEDIRKSIQIWTRADNRYEELMKMIKSHGTIKVVTDEDGNHWSKLSYNKYFELMDTLLYMDSLFDGKKFIYDFRYQKLTQSGQGQAWGCSIDDDNLILDVYSATEKEFSSQLYNSEHFN